MKPVGKTYLIKVKEHKETDDIINGIYIPDNSSIHDLYYEGTIVEHGAGWTKKELKDLLPIGTNIIFEYKIKCGTKIIIGDSIYYIHEPKNILAIKED